jgi:hypothetical protein
VGTNSSFLYACCHAVCVICSDPTKSVHTSQPVCEICIRLSPPVEVRFAKKTTYDRHNSKRRQHADRCITHMAIHSLSVCLSLLHFPLHVRIFPHRSSSSSLEGGLEGRRWRTGSGLCWLQTHIDKPHCAAEHINPTVMTVHQPLQSSHLAR